MRVSLYFRFCIAGALLLGTLVFCVAQDGSPTGSQALPSFVGQRVSSVDVAGQPGVTANTIPGLIAVQEGQPLTEQKVNTTIAALKRSGRFQNVELDLRPQSDGVRVMFILQPAIYLGIYEFPGTEKFFPYSRLLQVANYPSQEPFSQVDVEQARTALVQFFYQRGFFQATVRPEVQVDYTHRLANVLFHTDLGRRAKVGEITFTGAPAEETQKLEAKLRSFMARVKAAYLKPGKPYNFARLQRATRYLQGQLRKQDYLTGQVKLVSAEYNPETNRADINFHVTMGPVVKVKVEGAHVWGRTQRRLIPIYDENAVDDELIREGQSNLLSYFQSKGYFDARVHVPPVEKGPEMTVLYQIQKDQRHRVNEISFLGNKHFDQGALASQLAVQKAKFKFITHGKFSQQLVRKSVRNLEDYYRADGFSHVQIVPKVTRNSGDVQIAFQITEGPQDLVDALHIEGNNTVPESQLAPKGLKLGAGKPYSQKLANEDRAQIMAEYLRRGYLIATVRATAKPLANDPNRLDVVYQIDEGPQVNTATVVTLGRKHTRQSFIDHTAKIKTGQPVDESKTLTAEGRLYSVSIFDWAEIDPKRPITTQRQEDMVIKLHESKRNSIVYGFGFEVINRGGSVPSGTVAVPGLPPVGLPSGFKTSEKTYYGPRGTIEYTRRNLRGRAESLILGAFAGRLDQRGSITYTDPQFRDSSWRASTILSGEHNSENPIFTARLGTATFQVQKYLDTKKTKTVFLRYNFQLTKVSELLIPDLVPPDQRNVHLSTVSATYTRDTRDNLLDAHRGIYQSFELGINPSVLGSNFSFARFLGQTAYYKNIGKDIIWANSIRLGLEQAYSDSVVPLSERFFSGGGSTLRGFPLNGAGPQRTISACGNPADLSTCSKITVPTGGNQLFIVNTELRFPLPLKKGLGLVTFYDGGNVYDRIGFHDFGANYSNTVGLGLRYATPLGPVRFDVGHNLNPVPGIKSTQIFVTLGQAF